MECSGATPNGSKYGGVRPEESRSQGGFGFSGCGVGVVLECAREPSVSLLPMMTVPSESSAVLMVETESAERLHGSFSTLPVAS